MSVPNIYTEVDEIKANIKVFLHSVLILYCIKCWKLYIIVNKIMLEYQIQHDCYIND